MEEHRFNSKEEWDRVRAYAKTANTHSDHIKIIKPTLTLKKKWVSSTAFCRDCSPKVITLGDGDGDCVLDPAAVDAVVLPVTDGQGHGLESSPSAASSSSGSLASPGRG
eukprot:3820944-Pyramimonas_sp.AAC.1